MAARAWCAARPRAGLHRPGVIRWRAPRAIASRPGGGAVENDSSGSDDDEDVRAARRNKARRAGALSRSAASRAGGDRLPPPSSSDAGVRRKALAYGSERARRGRGGGDAGGRGRGGAASTSTATARVATGERETERSRRAPRRASTTRLGAPPARSRPASSHDARAREIVARFDRTLRRGDLEGCVALLSDALTEDGADDDADDGWVGRTRDDDEKKRRQCGEESESAAPAANSSAFARAIGRRIANSHKDFLGACGAQRRIDLALTYASSLPPDRRLYASLLGVCARARDYSAAVDAFRLYADSSLAPDAFAYSGLISAAGKAGEMRAAKKALCDAIDAGACDDGVYNSFIDACARSGDWDAARETATRMRDDPRVRPNVRTYNSLITAAAKARNVRAAKEVLRELDEDLGRDAATDRTYGAALAAVAAGVGVALETETSAAGAVDADADVAATAKEATVQMGTVATVTRGETAELVRWGLEVYRRAEDAGCGGNDHALSSLFTALARAVAAGAWPGDDAVTRCVGIVNALVRESDDVLSDGMSDIENVGRGRKAKAKAPKPNAAVWSALVSVCARAGRAREALDALELMRARGHALDSYTLASALTACRGGVAGASAASSDANGVFATGPAGGRRRRDALEGAREAREGLTVFERAPKSASASAYVRNAAIALYAAVGRVDAAFALYEEMKAESAIDGGDDARTFSSSSSSSSSSSAAAAAAPGSSETTSASAMDTRRRTAPDTITYNTLLHSCGGRSATDGAEWAFSLVRDMRSARVPRSTRTYVGLMNAAARGAPIGRGAAAAKAVFDAAEEDDTVEGGAGNAYTYTALIDAQVKGGDPRAAFDTYEIMKRRNITPSVVTFGCLLNACGNIKSADGRSSDSDSDSADVEGVDQSNDDVAGDAVERAYALLGEMTERGVCPNDRCQNALVRVVSEAGRIDDMLEEVKAIARRRGRFERATLEGVVRALCRAAYAERALRILSWMDARGYAPRAPTYRTLVQTCASEGQVVWAWTLHQRMTSAGHRTDKASASGIVSALCHAAMATDAGEARVMLRRATEVYERCEAYGVAVEGEGEANPWDDDDDGGGGGGGDANRASERRGMTVEEELASFEAAAADDDDDDDGGAGAAGPACPMKLEAPPARPNDARTPAGEILTASSLRDMITASARIGDVAFALRLYRVDAARDALRPSKVASSSSSYEHNADDGGVRANVYEALVEACCHNGDVNAALEVFDDLKANDVVVSKVTLAFLESRCRREGVPDWRVYDVCAQMRKQVSAKKERRLAESVPRKTSSHHVRGAVEVGGYDDDDEGGDGDGDGDAYAGADGSVASAATASGGGGGGASSYDFYDEDEDDSYGAAGARRRSKESEEAWERARRAAVKSSAGGDRAKRDGGGGGDRGRVFEREVDLDWISKPLGDIYEGYYDDRAADAKGLDPLQAELRTKGLGARRKGGGR